MSASPKHDKILNTVGVVALTVGGILIGGGAIITDAKTPLAALWFATVPAVAAALLYLIFAPWNRTTLGRILMSLMSSVALLLGLTLVGAYWNPGPAWGLFIARTVFVIAGSVSWVLFTYIVLAQFFPPAPTIEDEGGPHHFTRNTDGAET